MAIFHFSSPYLELEVVLNKETVRLSVIKQDLELTKFLRSFRKGFTYGNVRIGSIYSVCLDNTPLGYLDIYLKGTSDSLSHIAEIDNIAPMRGKTIKENTVIITQAFNSLAVMLEEFLLYKINSL